MTSDNLMAYFFMSLQLPSCLLLIFIFLSYKTDFKCFVGRSYPGVILSPCPFLCSSVCMDSSS